VPLFSSLEEKGVKKRNSSPLKADEDQEVLKRLEIFFTGPDGNIQNIFFAGGERIQI
jgi:hypothetical protein